jgi:hypothetical protein
MSFIRALEWRTFIETDEWYRSATVPWRQYLCSHNVFYMYKEFLSSNKFVNDRYE